MKLIQISAMWCPACLIMRPRINDVAKQLNLEVVEYDYDLDEDIVKKYEVGTKLPVFILEDEKEIIRIVGEKKSDEILEILKGCLK